MPLGEVLRRIRHTEREVVGIAKSPPEAMWDMQPMEPPVRERQETHRSRRVFTGTFRGRTWHATSFVRLLKPCGNQRIDSREHRTLLFRTA